MTHSAQAVSLPGLQRYQMKSRRPFLYLHFLYLHFLYFQLQELLPDQVRQPAHSLPPDHDQLQMLHLLRQDCALPSLHPLCLLIFLTSLLLLFPVRNPSVQLFHQQQLPAPRFLPGQHLLTPQPATQRKGYSCLQGHTPHPLL